MKCSCSGPRYLTMLAPGMLCSEDSRTALSAAEGAGRVCRWPLPLLWLRRACMWPCEEGDRRGAGEEKLPSLWLEDAADENTAPSPSAAGGSWLESAASQSAASVRLRDLLSAPEPQSPSPTDLAAEVPAATSKDCEREWPSRGLSTSEAALSRLLSSDCFAEEPVHAETSLGSGGGCFALAALPLLDCTVADTKTSTTPSSRMLMWWLIPSTWQGTICCTEKHSRR
mmetsp:Transcript_24949/g.34229  ORF Transcript_24949/g.34229 Transcript_24949/m.34229 type:complete len:227 (-) Transcript_24949:1312-1992(-)